MFFKFLSFERQRNRQNPSLLCGWQGPDYSSHLCCLPGCDSARSWDWEPWLDRTEEQPVEGTGEALQIQEEETEKKTDKPATDCKALKLCLQRLFHSCIQPTVSRKSKAVGSRLHPLFCEVGPQSVTYYLGSHAGGQCLDSEEDWDLRAGGTALSGMSTYPFFAEWMAGPSKMEGSKAA